MDKPAEITTEKKLTPAQRKAIESLLTSGNITEAAASAGIHRATLYKWMADDTFTSALADAEKDAVQGLSRALAGLGELAGAALRDALSSSQKVSTRLRASEIVISNLLKIRELVQFEERLAELERRYADSH